LKGLKECRDSPIPSSTVQREKRG